MLRRLLSCVVVCSVLAACVSKSTSPETTQSAKRVFHTSSQSNSQGTSLHRDEEAARTRIALGLQYLQRGNTSQAKFNLEKAKELAPRFAEAHAALAYYYQHVQEIALAKESYLAALSFAPKNADLLNNYGVFLCQLQEFSKAEAIFRQAIAERHYLRTSQSYENLALCALKADHFHKAKGYLTQALQYEITPARHLLMASLYYATSELPEAYSHVLLLNEPSAQSWLLRYQLAVELQNHSDAAYAQQQLEGDFPKSQEAGILRHNRLENSEFSLLRARYLRVSTLQ